VRQVALKKKLQKNWFLFAHFKGLYYYHSIQNRHDCILVCVHRIKISGNEQKSRTQDLKECNNGLQQKSMKKLHHVLSNVMEL